MDIDLRPDLAGAVPVHLKIAADLRRSMDMGLLAPGDSLPSVKDLALKWDCTAGTVREAISQLKAEGRIRTHRGRTATVRLPPKRIALNMGWAMAQKRMVRQTDKVRKSFGALELTTGQSIEDVRFHWTYDEKPAWYELAHEFGKHVQVGDPISERKYEARDKTNYSRLSFSYSWIPVSLIERNPALLDPQNEPWPGGHQHQLWTVGIEIARFVRSAHAVAATPEDQQTWGIEDGVPMLVVRSHSVDTEDRVVEISQAWYPADRTELGWTESMPLFRDM